MNVLHLVAGDLTGGAASGAYWLHRAQRKIGIESSILTNSPTTMNDEFVQTIANVPFKRLTSRFLNKLSNTPKLLYPQRKKIIFSTGLSGIDITRSSQYKQSDIVHLHWINGLVSTKGIGKIKKPIVWTLRDMWPLTGGCHYAMDCENYTKECGHCPQLGSSSKYDLSRFILKQKHDFFPKNMTLVGISKWLSDCARSSAAFSSQRITTISNNLDTEEFKAKPKDIARLELGLDASKKYILLGAQNINDFYKGFDLLIAALHIIKKENIHLLIFGNADTSLITSTGIPFKTYGFLQDNQALSTLYSAADVFIAPSRMEAFGKTLVESMACRTPVVCFDATGPRDIIEHKVNGYKAKPFDSYDLANGIHWVLEQNKSDFLSLCSSAENRARTLFDSQVIAEQYKSLYEEILCQ